MVRARRAGRRGLRRGGFAEAVREAFDRIGLRATLREPGMGGLGRDDWRDLARWFLNARRVWLKG